MGTPKLSTEGNPWRKIFEEVRRALGNKRDTTGVLGSINWLRKQMELRGGNPNVVRNIIYRDKGKLADKRVLYAILGELWEGAGQPPLQVPELEVLLAPASEGDQEVMQLLGREKRRTYQGFVSSVRSGNAPKLFVVGRPGSGKTLLTDYIQQALELPPKVPGKLVRQEFSAQDLGASLLRLALTLGVSAEVFEARLVKIATAGAFSVQADAQTDVARLIVERVRALETPPVLLLHVSQSLSGQDVLGNVPLRLNTPDVPRVSVTEWLWFTLLEPLSKMPVSLLLSMAELPLSLAGRLGAFEGPVKLSPPTANEARRFVKARAPHLSAEQQEELVSRARRSFEDLRTLTLLAEAREPLPEGATSSKHAEQLSQLSLHSGDERLRDFLGALAVLSLPEFPTFERSALEALRSAKPAELNSLETSFLDAVPGHENLVRSFSRQLSRALRARLQSHDAERFRQLSFGAAQHYAAHAREEPQGEVATRYLHHLFAARAWGELIAWARTAAVPQSLMQRAWQIAQHELSGDAATLEAVARIVAAHYLRLGSVEHPDVVLALELLANSEDAGLRAWTALKRAESAVLQGAFGQAEVLIDAWPQLDDPTLEIEATLVRSSIARWRSQLGEAAALTGRSTELLTRLTGSGASVGSLDVKVAVWSGLVAKDRGDLKGALEHFESASTSDDLLRARLGFQQGDVYLTLGRFNEAQRALDEAVSLSHLGEAPASERARYLARRGTLHRRRGAFEVAAKDFSAALTALGPPEESAARSRLEHVKVRDEGAVNTLAQGDYDAAIFVFQESVAAFTAYGERFGVDASFRVLRSTLRLALAYWCRAHEKAYHPPFLPPLQPGSAGPEHPDLHHAQLLLRGIRERLARQPARYLPLQRLVQVAGSLIDPPEEAVQAARTGLGSARYPYQIAVGSAYLATAQLRAGHHQGLSATLQTAWEALGKEAGASWDTWDTEDRVEDRGLRVWLLSLELFWRARSGTLAAADETLAAALNDPQLTPYHEGLLRLVGEFAENDAQGWLPPLKIAEGAAQSFLAESFLRLPDALVARWRAQSGISSLSESGLDGLSARELGEPDNSAADDPENSEEALEALRSGSS